MRICEICFNVNSGYSEVIRIKDDKESFEISGHEECINILWEKVKNVKNIEKKSVQKVLKEIDFDRSE